MNLKKLLPLPLRTLYWGWKSGLPLRWMASKWWRLLFGEVSNRTLPYEWHEKPSRWRLIQETIDKYGYKSYLEIGCAGNATFDRISCAKKVGVDPAQGGNLRKTSDEFFADNKRKFDCIFIDGLHVYEQVRSDITNSLVALSSNGIIFMHDCMPLSIGEQAVPREQVTWTGDPWKAVVECRTNPDIDTAVCLIDRGVGVIVRRPNSELLKIVARQNFKRLTYSEYVENYVEWLRPIEYESIVSFIDSGR